MEKLKNTKKYELLEDFDFSDPKCYSNLFQEHLDDDEPHDIQWLTSISCFTQTMRRELGGNFDERTLREIDGFIRFSLDDESIGDFVPEETIDTSREFLEKMVSVLERND